MPTPDTHSHQQKIIGTSPQNTRIMLRVSTFLDQNFNARNNLPHHEQPKYEFEQSYLRIAQSTQESRDESTQP